MARCDVCGQLMERAKIVEHMGGRVRRYCSFRCFRSDLRGQTERRHTLSHLRA